MDAVDDVHHATYSHRHVFSERISDRLPNSLLKANLNKKKLKKTWIYKTLKASVKICCHELVNVDLMDFRPLLVEMLFITFSSFIFYIQMKITGKLRYKFIFPCTICTLKEK